MKRTERRSTRNPFSFLPALVAMALVFAVFMTAGKPGEARRWGGNSGNSRVMVILNTEITDSLIIELASYGKVHGWIERYNLVAMTPKRGRRASVAALWFVDYVETDAISELTDVGTWDRDIIDAVDVEETGFVGGPDAREVEQTGAGVYVAVIDTGLTHDWRDFLDESRVVTSLARSFVSADNNPADFPRNAFKVVDPTNFWERDVRGHGLAVASHIIGFRAGNVLVDGVAPDAKLIPLRVTHNDPGLFIHASSAIAATAYVTGLVEEGIIGPTVINMSFGAPVPQFLPEVAIDDAIAAGIVIVSSAGNDGEAGMTWPAAYPQVISVGAVGWNEWFRPGSVEAPNFDFWWTQDVGFDPDRGRKGREADEVFVVPFSSRAIPDLVPGSTQELDVLAPGAFTVAPNRLGASLSVPSQPGLFFVDGTSFASPLTAGVAALILEKNPTLGQAEVEDILVSTALPLKAVDSRSDILIPFPVIPGAPGLFTFSWDTDCFGLPCDAVGAGLVQADDALAATPNP